MLGSIQVCTLCCIVIWPVLDGKFFIAKFLCGLIQLTLVKYRSCSIRVKARFGSLGQF